MSYRASQKFVRTNFINFGPTKLTKQTSESACLLKQVRTHDEHQPLITLVSLGAKSHSPRSKGKLPSTLQDFGDKSHYFVTDANPSTSSHSGSPTGMSKKKNYIQLF